MIVPSGRAVRVTAMTVWFLMVVREWIIMSYLIISVPPVRFPVMGPTMRSIIVWRMMMARMVVMRTRMSIMMRGGVVVPGMVMRCSSMTSRYVLATTTMACRVVDPVCVVNMLLRMRVSPGGMLMHI
jgi:hypothetical protein